MARTPADRELRLERMTSPEVARALEDGFTTAIVTCGAIEQHGPPPAALHGRTDLMGVIDLWREVAERETGRGDRVGGHADLAETSIMLALHPGLVREDEAAPGYVPEPGERETPVERFIREGFDAGTPNGILGDARGATGELGEAMIAALADAVAATFAEDGPTDGPAASTGREDRG